MNRDHFFTVWKKERGATGATLWSKQGDNVDELKQVLPFPSGFLAVGPSCLTILITPFLDRKEGASKRKLGDAITVENKSCPVRVDSNELSSFRSVCRSTEIQQALLTAI